MNGGGVEVSSLHVRDLMTAEVKTAKANDPLLTVQDLMNEHNFRHVPVVDEEGLLVGLISERDMLRRALTDEDGIPLTMRSELLGVMKVSEVMTDEVQTVEADDTATAAAEMLFENKYGCLPVVDEGYLIGILTEADFVRHVAGVDVQS